MKINELDTSYSEKVTNRFIELSNQGKIFYPDELSLFDHLSAKYKAVTISEYARLCGKPYKTIVEWIDKGKLMTIDFGGVTFIINK